jgi:hypothetical protein
MADPAVLYTQEDTFEGVKVNVYQILGDISASFSHQQMDMLFSKFQAAKSRPVPDTLLLLELCRRLAFSDKQVSRMMCLCLDCSCADYVLLDASPSGSDIVTLDA